MTTIVEKITMVVRSALELNPKFFKVSSFVFKLMKQFFARVAEICLVTSVLTNILFYAYQNKYIFTDLKELLLNAELQLIL